MSYIKKQKREKRGGHYILNPTPLSEALVVGIAMHTAKQLVKAQDAQPKMPEKIGEADFRLKK